MDYTLVSYLFFAAVATLSCLNLFTFYAAHYYNAPSAKKHFSWDDLLCFLLTGLFASIIFGP